MKILFVIYHPLGFGGAEVSTKFLAEGLKKRGHEVIFASHGNYDGFKNYKLKNFKKIPLFFLHDIYVSMMIKNIVKEEKPDLVHVHDRLTSIGTIKACKKLKIPVVVHFRDYWVVCPNSSCMTNNYYEYDVCTSKIIFKHFPMKRWLWDLYKLIHIKKARKTLMKADLKFANSDMIKKRLELVDVKDVKVVNILRDLDKFSPDVKKGKIKEKFNLDQNVITFVGGYTLVKGVMFITKLISEIIAYKKGWCFLIAGHGPLENDLRNFVKNKNLENKIKVVGMVNINEMPSVYADSDIVVLPSLWEEPLSGVILEAGASAIPVIASNKGGNKDAIIDGKTGFIVNAKDEKGWKEKLIELMANKELRANIGKNARKHVLENFSIDKVSEEVEKEYKKLIR